MINFISSKIKNKKTDAKKFNKKVFLHIFKKIKSKARNRIDLLVYNFEPINEKRTKAVKFYKTIQERLLHAF